MAVLRLLNAWLAKRNPARQDRDDITSEALYRLIAATLSGRLDPERPPGAWLRVVADRLWIDRMRASSRHPGVEFDEARHGAASDDDVIGLLHKGAAMADVRWALRRCAADGDDDVVRIVTAWIDLAALDHEPPSSRRVGEKLGVSHMTVQRGLTRFANRLAERQPQM
jgi:DNA-directed RNA polymerase specialized sigma24 family protein